MYSLTKRFLLKVRSAGYFTKRLKQEKVTMARNISKILLCAVLSVALIFTTNAAGINAGAAVSSTVTEIISAAALDDSTVSSAGSRLSAGTGTADWYVFACARLGVSSDYGTYLDNIKAYISENSDRLSAADYQRMALAVNAAAGASADDNSEDAQSLGLLDEAVYSVLDTDDLPSTLTNKLIFALLTLDSLRYTPSEEYATAREALISAILSHRLASGAFDLNGTADTDTTAMAVQSLAPYINSAEKYMLAGEDGEEISLTVSEVIDSALDYLSTAQTDSGDMTSWGTANCESTAQTIVALCCVGIDPCEDERFIKNGSTLIDGLLAYRTDTDGCAFAHAVSEDGDLTENALATAQALYALCAYCRGENGYRTLYDMREEMSDDTYTTIEKLKCSISTLNADADTDNSTLAEQTVQLMSDCSSVFVGDRMYIINFNILADAAASLDIENTADYLPDDIAQSASTPASLTDVTEDRNADDSTTIGAGGTSFETLDTAEISSDGSDSSGSALRTVVLLVILAAAVAVIILNHRKKPKE